MLKDEDITTKHVIEGIKAVLFGESTSDETIDEELAKKYLYHIVGHTFAYIFNVERFIFGAKDMPADKREKLYSRWLKAIERSQNWLEH